MSNPQDFAQPPLPPQPPRSGGGGVVAAVVLLGFLGVMGLACCGAIGAGTWYLYDAQSDSIAYSPVEIGTSSMAVASADAEQLRGEWRNTTTNTVYTIDVSGGWPTLVSVVSESGNYLEVVSSNWDGAELHWQYRSSSPATVVDERARYAYSDTLEGTSTITFEDGFTSEPASATWLRESVSPSGFSADTLAGEWVNDFGVRLNISVSYGQPQLSSVVTPTSPSGEYATVETSDWDGTRMHWRYRIESSNSVVEEYVSLEDADHLNGDCTTTDAYGLGYSSTSRWTRASAAGYDTKPVEDYPSEEPYGGDAPPTDFSQPPADASSLAGLWINRDSRVAYSIRLVDGVPQLVSAVDDDAEVCPVDSSYWDGSVLSVTVRIPSTSGTWRHSIRRVDDQTLASSSESIDSLGTVTPFETGFDRALWDHVYPGASQWEGTWLSNSSTRYQIRLQFNGAPELYAVTSAAGESYTVLSTLWDSGILKWRLSLPSGYTLDEQAWLSDRDTLGGAYTSTAPDGFTNTGTDTWRRETTTNAPPTTTSGEDYAGIWVDDAALSVHTVEILGGQPTVTSTVGLTGVIYELSSSNWDGNSLTWTYRAPESVAVTETAQLVDHDHMTGSYTYTGFDGTPGSGRSSWTRRTDGGQSSLRSYEGQWVSSLTNTVYTIRVTGDTPELVSAVDDDGEVFPVERTNWDGTRLTWRVSVPSTGYTLEESASLSSDANVLQGETVSTPPGGFGNTSSTTWSRQAPTN